MKRDDLHPTQQKLLGLIGENLDTPLSQRELQDALGLSSVSIVQHHIKQLEKKGFFRRNSFNPRDYTIINAKIAYLNLYDQDQCGSSGSVLDGEPLFRIPISVDLLNSNPAETFTIRAVGDSMKPRIYPGDIVIVKSSGIANDGDVVVCVNNQMTLIKQLRFTNKGPMLVSFNNNYEPFEPAEDFRIEGKVVGVLTYQI